MKASARWMILAGFVLTATALAEAQTTETRPAPGEEVMRPTQRGLRLSPAMATAMCRLVLRNDLAKDLELSDEQERQIADASARRLMTIAHRDGREGGPAVEFFTEVMITGDGKVRPEYAREFGEKMQPLMHAGREMLDGFVDDARPVVNDDQLQKLERSIANHRKLLDRLDKRLAEYREQGLEKPDSIFDDLEKPEDQVGQEPADQRIVNARRSADWDLKRGTSWEWSQFLTGAGLAFNFDAEQTAKGQALLAEYRQKADAIRTDEWRARLTKNRTLYFLQWEVRDVVEGPWLRRLEKEYDDAMRPVKELGLRFQRDVLALATPQQRAEAVEAARLLAEKNGYEASSADLAMLLGVLQPAAPPATP